MANAAAMTRPNNAPNLFLVLLWHHFCFYKRHPVLFVASILMPFALIGGMYFLIFELSGSSPDDRRLMAMQKYLPCVQQTKPLATSGPYHQAGWHSCLDRPLFVDRMLASSDGYTSDYPSNRCVNESNYVEESLSDSRPFCSLGKSAASDFDLTDVFGYIYQDQGSGYRAPSMIDQGAPIEIEPAGLYEQQFPGPTTVSPPTKNATTIDYLAVALAMINKSRDQQQSTAQSNRFSTTSMQNRLRSTAPPIYSGGGQSDCRCLQLYSSTYDRCALLRGHVVFYPNTTRTVQRILQLVEEEIDSYGRWLNRIYLASLFHPADFLNEARDLPISDFRQMIQFAQCFEPASDRVRGFRTRDEMLMHVKYLNDSLDPSDVPREGNWPSRILWAAINFERITDENASILRYSILRENKFTNNQASDKSILIQDLIESSVLKLKLNSSSALPFVPMLKDLPSKCWIRPSWTVHQILGLLLPIIVVSSFIFAPVNFLEQTITEKQLKLREYLSIMGVSDFRLKLSWIAFYLIFMIPASILAALFVHGFYGDPFGKTQASILIVQFLLYNLSQLFLAYFLSSFLKEPKRVSFILGFLNMLPSSFAVCAFHFGGNQLSGAMLIVFRVASLHCSVPFVLSLCYVIDWETFWIGGRWENAYRTPSLRDGYCGFGEGLLWMAGDSILYLVGAWYLQQVMPGEYGVRRKLYFFLQPSYWMPRRFGNETADPSVEQIDTDGDPAITKPDIEPRLRGAGAGGDRGEPTPTLVIERLTKFYNRQKMGVDRLSLSIYKNEITSLLGQNGAGKSTTMNTLVGLLSPTSGRFVVAGLDSKSGMDQIKKVIGFVPQYDILYPSMTVEEHLQFFGWLKGLSKHQILTTIYPLLEKFGMSHLKRTMTTNLSGGQKRKLSILTAYLGDPELVILDEPTTGVDPFSRRSIWDVLLHHRHRTATIVSTHFMDEADLLSDRIAVISDGSLKCVGTPMYLKQKYARGYRIIVACREDGDSRRSIENARRFFSEQSREFKVDIELSQVSGRDSTFTVSKEFARSRAMPDLLRSIEDRRSEIGIDSFGISEPTLEEAFFVAAGVDVSSSTKAQPTAADDQHQTAIRAGSAKFKYTNQTGIQLWTNQFWELLRKRYILAKRTPSGLLMQILLPLAFVVILLLTSNAIAESKLAQLSPVHIYETYRQNVLFFQVKGPRGVDDGRIESLLNRLIQSGLGPRCPGGIEGFQCDRSRPIVRPTADRSISSLTTNRSECTDCSEHCPEGNSRQFPHWTAASSDMVYELPNSVDTSDWILAANRSDHIVVGGFQIHRSSFDPPLEGRGNLTAEIFKTTPLDYVVIWTRPDTRAAMLNAHSNLVLQTFVDPNQSIQLYNEDLHFPSPEDDHPTKINASNIINTFVASFLLIMAFTYATFGIAVSIQQEKGANLKELQYVNGAKPGAYWLANYAWDFLQYMLTMAVLMFFLGVIENGSSPYLSEYVSILIPYGLSAIGFIYLISFRLKSATGVNKIITICFFLCSVAGPIICIFEYSNYRSRQQCDLLRSRGASESVTCRVEYQWAVLIGYVLRMCPYYLLADGCFLIGMVHAFGSLTVAAGPMASAQLAIDMYATDMLGKRICQGYVAAGLWLLILVLVEYKANGLFGCSKGGTRRGKVAEVEDVEATHHTHQDPDVRDEEQRVLQNRTLEAPLVVKRVTKKYPKSESPAVDSVTFSIPRRQCFGLLGINGAGKTSLFRIMTGFQSPTSGEAFIENRNVVTEKLALSSNISYCPQENTLFDQLSIREHLRLFAAFRGIPRTNLAAMLDALIDEVGLGEHAHKLAKQLSGGNKRKLNFALALLDYKPVVFLDEPTSGMDPGARRRTWTCIQNAIDRGCSVVLTSHSMDECEALCHRLVIMARGKICCIGSVQYLKDKFGNRYTVKIKLANRSMPIATGLGAVSQRKMDFGDTVSEIGGVPVDQADDQQAIPDDPSPNAVASDEPGADRSIDQLKQYLARRLPDSCLIEEHETMLQYEVGAGSDHLSLSTLFGVLSDLRRAYPHWIEDFTLSQVTLERVFVSMAQRQAVQDASSSSPPNPLDPNANGRSPMPLRSQIYGSPRSQSQLDNEKPTTRNRGQSIPLQPIAENNEYDQPKPVSPQLHQNGNIDSSGHNNHGYAHGGAGTGPAPVEAGHGTAEKRPSVGSSPAGDHVNGGGRRMTITHS